MKNSVVNLNRTWPPNHLMLLRKSWDMIKGCIFYRNSEEERVFKWLDGRKIKIADTENKAIDNISDLNRLTYVTSNLNPLLTIHTPLQVELPQILSGTCMDQYGNLFSYRHTDTSYQHYTITHIACGYQSPLYKYDGETFLIENVMRRISAVSVENIAYVYLKDLPYIQQTQIVKDMPQHIEDDKILFDVYGSWHYQWYEDNRMEYWRTLADIK